MKRSKLTTQEIEEQVRILTIFVSDLLGKPSLGQQRMKDARFKYDRSAIEMIHQGKKDEVMLLIHKLFF